MNCIVPQELLDCQEDNNMGQAYEACQGTAYEAWLKSGSASLAAITMGRSGSPLVQQPTQRQVMDPLKVFLLPARLRTGS